MSSAYAWFQRKDSNLRPQGYGPRELPLLYSGMFRSRRGTAADFIEGMILMDFFEIHDISISPILPKIVPGLSPICPIR